MTKPLPILLSIVMLMSISCQQMRTGQERGDEKTILQAQVDSLTSLLENNQMLAETLHEADILMDSIDVNRDLLRNQMREGTSLEDFTARMKDLNDYVKRSESKINDLEKALRSAKQTGPSYNARIKELKESLEKNQMEIAALQEQVTKYKGENETLITTVNLQQAEIEDKLIQIAVREEEVVKLEGRITEILEHAKRNEGDAYYARGEALELVAVRTNFAPKKKKVARQEALSMYKMAALYGKAEAQKKVDELAKKL
jgi:chromosome segregation ATPase